MHAAKLNISNHRQEVWTATIALSGDLPNSLYSLQQALNSTFSHYDLFAELGWKPF